MVRVVIEGVRIDLDANGVLGVGGEATVYRHGDLAVKIYHGVDAGLPRVERERQAALLEQKLEKLSAFPNALPPCVVAPKAIVFDAKKRPVGYAMPVVEGAVEIASLMKRGFRAAGFPVPRVIAVFERLAAALEALHAAGVVVGDLNDGNVLVVGDDVRFIDVDSMQFGRWPCPVAHERYLDPRLYGVDLAGAPRFQPENDWYAYCVLLFNALLFVHPFGGVHPAIGTFLRRAAAGASLLSSLVKRPKAAQDPAILPDRLRELFLDFFERGIRNRYDPSWLAGDWTTCACGADHARAVCPLCASRGRISPRPVVTSHGACRVTPIVKTPGRIARATVEGGVCFLVEENGWLFRETRACLGAAGAPGTRYAITRGASYRAEGDRVVELETDTRLHTSTFDGRPAFAATAEGCLLVVDDHLVVHPTGRRIGPVVGGTTWIASGRHLGFGFYRVGLMTKFFVFSPKRAGLTFVELPAIRGRVKEAHAVFDERTVVFSLVTDEGGTILSHLYVVGADGTRIAAWTGAPESSRVLAAPRGRCVMGGLVVTATDDGIVALSIDRATGAITEGTLFSDTEPFVSADVELLPAPGGALYVVSEAAIDQLALV